MKRLAIMTMAIGVCLNVSTAIAQQISVSNPWVRTTMSNRNISAGYLEIKNTGVNDAHLIGIGWPEDSSISGLLEIHETTTSEDAVMKMERLEGGLIIPKGGKVILKPKGKHIMLMGLSDKILRGDKLPIKLIFKHKSIVVDFIAE